MQRQLKSENRFKLLAAVRLISLFQNALLSRLATLMSTRNPFSTIYYGCARSSLNDGDVQRHPRLPARLASRALTSGDLVRSWQAVRVAKNVLLTLAL
jgi:hypothetical protein